MAAMPIGRPFRTVLALALALSLCVAATPRPSQASSALSIVVQTACLVNAGSLSGSYSGVLIQAPAAIQLECNPGTNATIALGPGNHAGSCPGFGVGRCMANGTNYVAYDIYTDATYSTVWNTSNTVAYAGTGALTSQNLYFKVPGAQYAPPAGTYTDTVAVTVTF